MTVAADRATEADPLRLAFCPACGYALDGLHGVGTCPECGTNYGFGRVVLRAWPADPVSRYWLDVLLGAVGAAVVLWGSGRPPYGADYVAAAVSLLVAMVGVADRLLPIDGWPNPLLLWLTPIGIAVQSTRPADSLVGVGRRILVWAAVGAFVTVILQTILFHHGHTPAFWVAAASFAVATATYSRETASAPIGGKPDLHLTDWDRPRGIAVTLHAVGGRRYHLTVADAARTANGRKLFTVEVRLTVAAVARLRDHIRYLRDVAVAARDHGADRADRAVDRPPLPRPATGG